jgi:hypothetical protein
MLDMMAWYGIFTSGAFLICFLFPVLLRESHSLLVPTSLCCVFVHGFCGYGHFGWLAFFKRRLLAFGNNGWMAGRQALDGFYVE